MRKNRFAAFLTMVAAALVLVFGVATPARAQIDPGSTGNIVVEYPSDETNAPTAKAYKLIEVNFDYAAQQPIDPEFKWAANVATWLKGNGFTDYVGTGNAVQNFEAGKTPADASKKLYQALAAAIKSGDLNVTAEQALTGRGMGVYLVVVSGGVNTYSPMVSQLVPEKNATGQYVISNGKVTMKAEKPSIKKTVEKLEVVGKQVGDDATYDVIVKIPDYPDNATATKFIVADKMPKGLKYNRDLKVYGQLTDSVDEKGVPLSSDVHYELVNQDLQGSTGYDYVASFKYSQVKSYEYVHLVYTAELTSEAELKPTGNVNEVELQYNNDPYDANSYQEIPDDAKVVTYGAKVKKTDGKGTVLGGASFTLSKNKDGSDPIYFVSGTEGGSYIVADNDDRNTTVELAVVNDGTNKGMLNLGGLEAGVKYYLTETKAPDGYNKITTPVEIQIIDSNGDGIVDSGSDAWVEYEVVNKKGFQLPTTGGAGTAMFAAAGVVLVGGGAALYFNLRKRDQR